MLRPYPEQKTYINKDDEILAKVINNSNIKKVTPEKKNPVRKAKLNPDNGKTFTIKEAFKYIESDNMNANRFLKCVSILNSILAILNFCV